jgi:hypothetical protein
MEKLLKEFSRNCDVDAILHHIENALMAMTQIFLKGGKGGWGMPKYVLQSKLHIL